MTLHFKTHPKVSSFEKGLQHGKEPVEHFVNQTISKHFAGLCIRRHDPKEQSVIPETGLWHGAKKIIGSARLKSSSKKTKTSYGQC